MGGAPKWRVGNIHAHSLCSDGALSLSELAQRNRGEGYDFMASTEHNTSSSGWLLAGAAKAARGLSLIPGVELTTPGGHANIIGQSPEAWYDFRTEPGDGGLEKVFHQARKDGCLVVVNHPFDPCTTCSWKFSPTEWSEADGIEVWNGAWDPFDEKALALWDSMLREGKRLIAFGGSDYHRDPNRLSPAVKVWTDSARSADLVAGLKSGRVVLLDSPKGLDLKLEVRSGRREAGPGQQLEGAHDAVISLEVEGAEGALLSLHGAKGPILEGVPVTSNRFRQKLELKSIVLPNFIRAELRRPDRRMLALANPVFLPAAPEKKDDGKASAKP